VNVILQSEKVPTYLTAEFPHQEMLGF